MAEITERTSTITCDMCKTVEVAKLLKGETHSPEGWGSGCIHFGAGFDGGDGATHIDLCPKCMQWYEALIVDPEVIEIIGEIEKSLEQKGY